MPNLVTPPKELYIVKEAGYAYPLALTKEELLDEKRFWDTGKILTFGKYVFKGSIKIKSEVTLHDGETIEVLKN